MLSTEFSVLVPYEVIIRNILKHFQLKSIISVLIHRINSMDKMQYYQVGTKSATLAKFMAYAN